MIKKMKWGGMLVASLLMASSCQNEEIIETPSAGGQRISLTVGREGGSRTALVGDQAVWSKGDKIYVSSKDGKTTGVLTLQGEGGDATGTFSGFVFGNPANLAYSVYPAPTNGTTIDLANILASGQLNAPMIGAINQDEEVDVQFRNQCGILYINMNGSEGQSFNISATDKENSTNVDLLFAGSFDVTNIDWTDDKPSLIFDNPTSYINVTNTNVAGSTSSVMYVPYYITNKNVTLDKVTFMAGGTLMNDEPINFATLENGFVGSVAQDNINELTYNDTGVQKSIAKIGDAVYTSLQDAIGAVQDGETITLVNDVEITEPAYGQNALNHDRAVSFTMDLNGKTLSADTGNSVFRFNISATGATSDVTVTLKNGTITSGDNTWCTVMATGISETAKAILNLEYLTINASKAGDLAVKSWSNAVVNADNVTVNATKCTGGFYAVGGEIVLDNCIVNQMGLHTAPYLSMAIAVSNGGKLTVNSGTYKTEPTAVSEGYNQGSSHGSWCAGVMNSGGTLIINGGTFINGNFGEDALATAARGLLFGDTASKIVINDGTFNALKSIVDYQNNLGVQPNPNIIINGGDFSANPAIVTSYGGVVFADGKIPAKDANGRWTLVDDVTVKNEAGLRAAFAEGGDIVLGADITVTEPIVLAEDNTATLDLNGFAINAAETTGNHIYALKNYGTLIIKDLSTEKNGSINSRGIYNYGSLTLNSGKVSAIDSNGGYAVNNQQGSTFVMNGGWIAADIEDGDAPEVGNYDATALNVPNTCIATLNGGKITNAGNFTFAVSSNGTLDVPETSTIEIIGRHGAFAVGGGVTTINAGTYSIPLNTANTDNVTYAYGGKLIINGGTFIADNDSSNGGCCVYDEVGGATINGGTFRNSSGGDVWGTTGTVIKGGKFENLTETSYIAEGYHLVNGEVLNVN